MKLNRTLLLFIAVLAVELSFGQNIEKIFGKRQETYFSFLIKSKDEIHTLTKIISIDKVKGNTVWAYANMKEFIEFSRLGYNITLLPHPGDVPGVQMTDHVSLSPLTTWNYYPTYTAYEDLMNQFQALYPSICQVQTIATLASGRKIMIAKISDNVAIDEAEPEFLYTSSIHGDETTGYVLMLHLMDFLLSNYGTNAEVTSLINTMEIYINPLANPDGTYAGGNATVNGATRYNGNGVDMNRNYPDPVDGLHPDGEVWQPETVAFMDFATAHHFVASCNFHGGAEVVNYPWDTQATLTADDTWWQYVSHEYVDTARIHGNTSYMTDTYASGITDGYVWYEVNGGRQDYMNYVQHCRECTIELSETKTLSASSLPTWWNYNWRSFLLYMKEARFGIHGIITDANTGLPVAAKVFVNSHDVSNSETYSSANLGDYSRLIKAGTYSLTVTATNYVSKTITGVVVADHNTTTLNIQLVPIAVPIVVTMAASPVSATTAALNGTVNPKGFSTTYSFEWGTTTAYGNSTTSGSAGAGTVVVPVSANLTGLTAGTLYHFRLNATNSNGTSNGSDMTFSYGIATVATTAVTAITMNSAASGGSVTSDGGAAITAFGVCWSTTVNPVISGSHTTDGSGTGTFISYITGLTTAATYHVRAYATNSTGTYYGSDLPFSTPCGVISSFPWNEGFENAGAMPNCWTQEMVGTSGINWTFISGDANSHPAAAHGGTYNACLKDATAADNKTKLITPTLNIAALSSPVLKFWHTQPVWSGDQDQLIVYYRTSSTGNWTVLATYTASIIAWTMETINLPNATSDYYIAFEGNAKYGYGVCLDDVSITGTMKTLSVTPPNQSVTAAAGNTTFNVTSNSNWTASSDQSWCTVPASGTGNGTITAAYTQNLSGALRVAHITTSVSGLSPVAVTVSQNVATEKNLNITVFLEGLFNGSMMRKASGSTGDQFSGTVADQITIELHESVSPFAMAGGPYTMNLNTDGTGVLTVPVSLGASYYIVIKQRNSIETWSGVPVSFGGTAISFDFSSAAGQAFGNNLKLVSGKYVIYGGDVNQDGVVNSADINAVYYDASNYLSGYLADDIDGDGIIDLGDMIIPDNNSATHIAKIVP